MDFKKIFKNTIIIFLLFFPLHFLYSKTKIALFIPFAPVNESIFEHLKIFLTANILYGFISLRRNYFVKVFIRSLIEIIIFLAIYLPLYYLLGENMIITFTILFISIFLSELVLTRIDFDKLDKLNIISLILIIISYIIFTYLSYNPVKTDLFKDPKSDTYGLNN